MGKELRRPRSIWWCEFYSSLPFSGSCTSTARGRRRSRRGRTGTFGASARLGGTSSTPAFLLRLVYLNGQGATAHKLEPDRLRRPTEGNGPRAPTFDASGLQAISSSPRRADLWLRGQRQGLLRPACHGALGATQDMGVADAEARATAGVRELSWLHLRLDIQRRRGEPCVAIHRWTQLRLFSAFVCTDDPLFLAVSLERAKRAFRVWRRLTNAIRLVMAISETRTLGSGGRWLGVNVISNLGLVVVLRNKVLQASAAIADVLNGGVHFHVFRSLCGMLASSGGLTLRVVQRQRQASLAPCGARRSAENPLRRNLRRLPADVDRAGTGGSRHGLFWFHEVSEDPRPYLTIPVLESLAVGCGLLAFLEQAVPGRAGRMCASSCAPTPSPLCSPSQRAPLTRRLCRRSTTISAPPPSGDPVPPAGSNAPLR